MPHVAHAVQCLMSAWCLALLDKWQCLLGSSALTLLEEVSPSYPLFPWAGRPHLSVLGAGGCIQ